MRYFKVKNEEQAINLSKEMYKLLYPGNINVSTTYLFGWKTNDNGECVVEIPEEEYSVLNSDNLIKSKVIEYLEDNKSINNKIVLSDLLSKYEEVNRQYLIDNGFIKISSSPIE